MLAALRSGLRHLSFRSSRTVSFSTTTAVARDMEMNELHVLMSTAQAEKDEATARKEFGSALGGAEADSTFGKSQRGNFKTFKINSVIRPHELTYKARVKKPLIRRRPPQVGPPPSEARYKDVFHQLGIDPLVFAQNPVILHDYMSEMGKIYSRGVTGLTSKNQRRMGQAIRRAKMMGMTPILSKHDRAQEYARRIHRK